MLDVFLQKLHLSNQFFNSILIFKIVDLNFEVVFLLCKSFQSQFRELKLFFDKIGISDLLPANTVNDNVNELEGFLPHIDRSVFDSVDACLKEKSQILSRD